MSRGRRRRRRRRGPPRWCLARAALRRLLGERAGPDAEIETGRVERVGNGLSRDIYAAYAEVSPDPHGLSDDYAILIPRDDADPEVDERAVREAALLERLAAVLPRAAAMSSLESPPFRVPRVLGVAEIDDGRRALVRTFETGLALPTRADRARVVEGRPWEVVGRVAAGVHAIDVAAVADVVSGHRTRRTHAEAELEASFAGVGSDVEDARAWLEANLPPPDGPARLLHGDLLGQNILVGHELVTGEEGPPALIDWEYARTGDPAYDLAIVTRGVRRPFGMGGGLRKLLASYADAGGAPLGEKDVRFHELCLAVRWYGDSLAGRGRHPPEEALKHVRRVSGMARADG